MARKPNVFPSYLRHSSGQARIRVAGRDIMLGPYGSDESRIKYGQLIAQMAGGVPLGGRIKVSGGENKGGENKGVRNLYREAGRIKVSGTFIGRVRQKSRHRACPGGSRDCALRNAS